MAVAVAVSAGFAIPATAGSFHSSIVTTQSSGPYTIHDLGTLPGGTLSAANAVNDQGQVIGESTNASGATRAVLWENGVMTDLGDLGGGMSTANAINELGQVVGASTNSSGGTRAFLWQHGSMTDLGTLPGGYWSRATGINNKGQVVGWSGLHSGSANSPDPASSFLWQDGVMTDLGRPEATASWPLHRASAINDAGQIVVQSDGGPSGTGIDVRTFVWQAGVWTNVTDPSNPPRAIGADINNEGQVAGWSGGYSRFTGAWVWHGGVLRDIGTLGGFQPEAHAINDAGQVVGYDQVQGGAMGVGHGFLWDNGTMTDLGGLFDGGVSMASDVNSAGDVVGWAYPGPYGPSHAVLWTAYTTPPPRPPPPFPIRDLGVLPNYNVSSTAYGVNGAGQTVGASTGAVGIGTHAFLWENGTMTDLGTLGGPESVASALNDAGLVVGWSTPSSGATLHAFLWENGTMTDLGSLGGGHSEAHAINNAGQIVGRSDNVSGMYHAFLWENGRMTDLGTLGGYSEAYAINKVGQIVGGSDHAPGAMHHAVLWENGTMTDLGTLGGNDSEAYAINNAGQIVGRSEDASHMYHAFLWQHGVMTDLGTLGGIYSEAYGINNAGQIVGGSDNASGVYHAFLWEHGKMIDLGTLAGGTQSAVYSISDTGLAVGESFTVTIYDRHAALWSIPPRSAPTTPKDLGTLPRYDWASLANDMNDVGQIVGEGWTVGHGASHAFLWDHGTMTDLVTRNVTGSSMATGVNEAGQVTGTTSNASGWMTAFLWQNGMVTDLGPGAANDLNNAGQVVGWKYTSSYLAHATVWEGGIARDLGTLGGCCSESWAYAINDAGQVVGASGTASGSSHAFLWENGTMTDLGTLFGGDSVAFGINGAGQVVGASTGPGGHPVDHAFLWAQGTLTDLGQGQAVDINDAGQIAGYWEDSTGSSFAIVWDGGTMKDLGSLGGGFSYVTRINNVGNVVGSTTRSDGSERAALWILSNVAPVSAHATAAASATDVGLEIKFTCTASGGLPPYQVAWDFGDNAKMTGGTMNHAYDSPGIKTATCTVFDSVGGTTNSAVSVEIYGSPTVTVTVDRAAASPGWPLTFSATTTGGSDGFTYTWDVGEGPPLTGAKVTHSYASSGTYTATVTSRDSVGGSDSHSITVVISAIVVTVAPSVTSAKAGETITFTASASGGAGGPYHISWDFGDGTVLTGPTATHAYSNPGSYTPKVTVTDAAGASHVTVLDTIAIQNPTPTPEASSSPAWFTTGGLAALAIGTVIAFLVIGRRRREP